jgi:hypothetical protein
MKYFLLAIKMIFFSYLGYLFYFLIVKNCWILTKKNVKLVDR